MRLPLAFTLMTCATAITAQEQPNTVLVMDGSGSMWGQIDGITKITIAQDVVAGLLSDFPADQGLGLTLYGHRERGVCTDIETIVAPAPGTAAEITAAVKALKPLGKTPMTDAVIAAAEALRYTEDKATVILVSDGVETCNPDPCAAARLLEEAGIDFTAHVIGFDVGSDATALAQMQCIAEETGGQFLTADTADQLTAALTQVAVAGPESKPEPEPVLIPTLFSAVIEGSDAPLIGPVLWDVTGDDGQIADDADGNPLTLDLTQGSYVATAYSVLLEQELSRQFVAVGDAASVEIAFPEPKPTASIIAPAQAVAGSSIQVGWNGPNEAQDYIGIGAQGASGASMWQNWALTETGNPVTLLVPPLEGPHVIQYFSGADRAILGSAEIMVTPVALTLETVADAPAGSQIEVTWTGPDYAEDYIGIGKVGADGAAQWENWAYTADGAKVTLTVPEQPGAYEIIYFMGQGRTPVHSVAFTATEVSASITAPAEAQAGSMIQIGWTGPDYPDDYVGIGRVDATGAAQWENWVYTREGSPVDLLVPAEPGDYLITYFQRQDRTPLTSVPITVTSVAASVTAPAQAVSGSTIALSWTGPNYTDDYIGVGRVDATGAAQWENWVYTRDGSPTRLVVPSGTGDYVITYFQRQDRTPLVQTAISLTAPKASLTAPTEAIAGSMISVPWTGPDYAEDYIGIGRLGASGASQWQTWRYTRDGSVAALTVPPTPGDYIISYFMRQDRTRLTDVPLSVVAPEASLTAPDRAAAGSTLEVDWVGPDYKDDYIGVGLKGAKGAAQWQAWRYTRDGSPAQITLPETPGTYILRYFMRLERTVLIEQELIVE